MLSLYIFQQECESWCVLQLERPYILVNCFFSVSHIEGITLGASEEVDEVAGGGMGSDRMGEIGDTASEGQVAGVYGACLWEGVGRRGQGTRLVLTRSCFQMVYNSK